MKILFLFFVFFFVTSITFCNSDTWHAKSNFGGVGRHRGTGISIGTKGYMGLGHYNGSGTNVAFSDWWEFDPSCNCWSQKADYPFPTYGVTSFTIGMQGYIVGGINAMNQMYTYNPFSNNWTQLQTIPLAYPYNDKTGFAVYGKGYYLVDWNLYQYDPQLDLWTQMQNLPFPSYVMEVAFVIGDRAFVKQGTDLYEYDALTDDWFIRAPLPHIIQAASAFSINGKGYIVCGFLTSYFNLSNEVWEYDPITDAWTQLENFPGLGRRFCSGFAIGNKGYFGIGTNGTNMRDFWEFDKTLSDEEMSNQIFISSPYPNPSSTKMQFKINTQAFSILEEMQLRIIDMQGREMMVKPINQNIFEISKEEIGEGVFIYQIIRKNQVIKTGKLIFE